MVVQSLQDAEVPRSLPTSPSAAQMRCLLSVVRFLDGMAQELVRTEQKPRRRAKERNPSSTVTVIGGVQEDGTHLVSRKCQNDKSLHILHLSALEDFGGAKDSGKSSGSLQGSGIRRVLHSRYR